MVVARGGVGGGWPVDLAALVDRDITIVGVTHAHPDLLTEVVAMAARGDVDLAPYIDDVAPSALGRGTARDRRRALVVTPASEA